MEEVPKDEEILLNPNCDKILLPATCPHGIVSGQAYKEKLLYSLG